VWTPHGESRFELTPAAKAALDRRKPFWIGESRSGSAKAVLDRRRPLWINNAAKAA
jgi:hypothetical protein